jgi:peptidoglycan/xylan/chitin deacetylase (PgdA/CDA1 family)
MFFGCNKIEYSGKSKSQTDSTIKIKENDTEKSYQPSDEEIIEKYKNSTAEYWSDKLPGMVEGINTGTQEKIIFLTFDACGKGRKGNGFDTELLNFLIIKKIKATFFINGRWALVNKESLMKISMNKDLFDIGNHGYYHSPLSINGKYGYKEKGTSNAEEVIDEIKKGEKIIYEITGQKTKYFRSGTCFGDEMALKILKEAGYEFISYTVAGDFGATLISNRVAEKIINSNNGDIILLHINHPESGTGKGVIKAIETIAESVKFGKLSDYEKNFKYIK